MAKKLNEIKTVFNLGTFVLKNVTVFKGFGNPCVINKKTSFKKRKSVMTRAGASPAPSQTSSSSGDISLTAKDHPFILKRFFW